MKKLLIGIIRIYQKIPGPWHDLCRHTPTCSSYMIEAIEKHGIKGVLMGIARILRCHPLVEGGDDPVPDYFTLRRNKDFRKKKEES